MKSPSSSPSPSAEPLRRLDAAPPAGASAVTRPHFEITTGAVWGRLYEAAMRDNVDLRDLGEAAAMYPAVRDGILRVANCVEPGPLRPFDDVTRAMVFMGLRRLRALFAERVEELAREEPARPDRVRA